MHNKLSANAILLLILAATCVSALAAPSVWVNQSGTISQAGDMVSVRIGITGLTSAPGQSLSGYDLNVLYNQSVLEFSAVSFIDGVSSVNQLDLAGAIFPFLAGYSLLPGTIDLWAVSGNDDTTLDALQADQFDFAVLTFKALDVQPTFVGIDLADPSLSFVDSAAGELEVQFGAASTFIQPVTSRVPDAGSSLILLMMAGLLLQTVNRANNLH